tara:strand:+ start:476 stop:781 length:306 start_codon:yes stop_codon:yes gene_type:complete
MTIKEIKEQLQSKKVTFNVKGHKEYQKGPNDEYGDYPTKFRTHGSGEKNGTGAIYKGFSNGMNVSKFGPTCVTLYTYDMLGKKTVGKIKYSDVTILEDETD